PLISSCRSTPPASSRRPPESMSAGAARCRRRRLPRVCADRRCRAGRTGTVPIPVPAASSTRGYRVVSVPASYLGTDVGGTFTGLVFYTSAGEVRCFKVPSTPTRPGASILEGIDEIKAALSLDESAWRELVH